MYRRTAEGMARLHRRVRQGDPVAASDLAAEYRSLGQPRLHCVGYRSNCAPGIVLPVQTALTLCHAPSMQATRRRAVLQFLVTHEVTFGWLWHVLRRLK
jgi:hypothetical protein